YWELRTTAPALQQQAWIIPLASSYLQSLAYNRGMANLILVYGLRLLPSDEVAEVGAATIKLKNGRDAHIAMHILEGGKDEIEKQLKASLAAFFDIYPEI
ncbi:MAG: hypothetical protein WBP52_22365, partial [Terriglobales bacterium]